ncbi:pyridoxamine 5'-phosphate oxidase [Alkalitalea saponilacus]|uniref:Pyridoxine/pyridoxamine 5'-phosphate oxidase n=1 Tax=Alkalitalea saponilacus TaxID=889453 RepID=A0A1T5A1L0_9BACT|nr:pyridoxamine 5'-phosphate oxidase [Alkalitalea saponilacus]ASB48918.1 pyridoxamine 5'-phosphate oxidase [Alkalitalea saponilacus]SKB28659.1 Pyridoxamine 5'-phosphate oxidase [Alkalitalea saponilacus]
MNFEVNNKLRSIRDTYTQSGIKVDKMSKNPLQQILQWVTNAVDAGHPEPTAMILSTIDIQCKPHSRVVLLKGVTENGLQFFTNYTSHKAQEIKDYPDVSLLFFWPLLERQLRIEGKASKISPQSSDEYFDSRPRASQIGAWASPQSQQMNSFEALRENFNKAEQQFKDQKISRPPHWGGYEVIPNYVEFWQGQPGRMHQRFCYRLINNKWKNEILAP